MIIMKGPRATTRHRLPTPDSAKLEKASNTREGEEREEGRKGDG